MSKKNKNTNQQAHNDRDEVRTVKYPIPFPDVANMDDVGYYPDDVLNDKISRLESERSRLLEMKFDPQRWELELAYLHRERQIRHTRGERHDAYVRDLLLRGDVDEFTMKTSFGPIASGNRSYSSLN